MHRYIQGLDVFGPECLEGHFLEVDIDLVPATEQAPGHGAFDARSTDGGMPGRGMDATLNIFVIQYLERRRKQNKRAHQKSVVGVDICW